MKTKQSKVTHNAIRASASIIPALIAASFFLNGEAERFALIGAIFAYFISFLLLNGAQLKNRLWYTLITILILSYAFCITHAVLEILAKGQSVLMHSYGIFVGSGFLSMMGITIMLPAWLLFILLDYFVCKVNPTH